MIFRVLLFLILLIQPCYCATIHAILLGDTDSDYLGDPISIDLDRMQKCAGRIARYCDLSLNVEVFKGKRLLAEDVVSTISKLQVEREDIILLFFSGHGWRTSSKDLDSNPWPNLYFSNTDSGIDFYNLCTMAAEKEPRFLLAISDTCNNYLANERFLPSLVQLYPKAVSSQSVVKRNYQTLFKETSGSLLLTATEKGGIAYLSTHGSLLTIHVERALQNNEDQLCWESVLQYLDDSMKEKQKIYYELQLRDPSS